MSRIQEGFGLNLGSRPVPTIPNGLCCLPLISALEIAATVSRNLAVFSPIFINALFPRASLRGCVG